MRTGLSRNLYTAAQVRGFDRTAIEQFGVLGLDLMRKAGRFCFARLRESWPDARSVVVLCGGGNNGGDGFVIAELAHRAGLNVTVLAMADFAGLSADAGAALEDMRLSGIDGGLFNDGPLPQCDVVVDAMLGTGLVRDVCGVYARAVIAANESHALTLSVDIPTGLKADSGAELGYCVVADLTCTFIGLKAGLFTGRGPHVAGTVCFDDLGLPKEVLEKESPVASLVEPQQVLSALKPLPRDAHKGQFGHALLVGGNQGYGGAALLAARACLRSGAGLVSVALHGSYAGPFAAVCPEAMFAPVIDGGGLQPLLARASAVAIGPGFGQDLWAESLLDAVLSADLPTVFDADALNLLAARATAPLPPDSIITPHPGEAARLLGCSTGAIQNDRLLAAKTLAKRYQACVVLKGAGTVIVDPANENSAEIATVGNPGLAAGGSGDTLTGITAAFLAQRHALGLRAIDVARLAVCAHGAAADVAAESGERGMTSSDVSAALRVVVNPRVYRS